MIRSLIVAIALIIGVTLPTLVNPGTGPAAYEQGGYAAAIKDSNLLAKQDDVRREETYQPPPLPQREDWIERVFFAPGDTAVLGFFVLTKGLGLPALQDMTTQFIFDYGDAFLGLVAAMMWLAMSGLLIPLNRLRGAATISYRKQKEEAQRLALDEQILANRAKTEFLANMSHELRTPLNAIIGFSEMLKQEYFGDLNPKQLEYVEDIHSSGNHLFNMINDILDISKIEAGRMELNEEDVDLEKVINGCLRLIKSRADEARIYVDIDFRSPIKLLRADEQKFKQILLNLLSNAVKFTSEGGKVEVGVDVNGSGDLLLTVTDTGIGMDQDDIPKAMKAFGQVDSALNRKYNGTGLGLPLTKSLVKAHGGSLTLKSDVGVGTTVTMQFPPDRTIGFQPESVQSPLAAE